MMRPLRLLLDGFGSYRDMTELDFSDVDYFVLVGPTGAGKSTVIDALCFALYGTVPRWGKENAIAHALAPSANMCRVALVFEATDKRYAAVRVLTRDKRGQVHTKEARLELLDPAVPADALIADLLAASVQQITEGPEQVKAHVQDILGLTYEHFTQSVLLPQGRFSEFLHAKPSERQNLLVELLAFGVYEEIGKRARRRAEITADRQRLAEIALKEVADATHEAEASATTRLEDLTGLTAAVENLLEDLDQVQRQAEEAEENLQRARSETGQLASIQMPSGVERLSRDITAADQRLNEVRKQRDEAEAAEAEAQRHADSLPDKQAMEELIRAYEDRRSLSEQLDQLERQLVTAEANEKASHEGLRAAEEELQRARDALAHVEQKDMAITLAENLSVGEDCPVCLQPVVSLPHHAIPPDLNESRAAVKATVAKVSEQRLTLNAAMQAAAAARHAAESTRDQLDRNAALLANAPRETEVAAALTAIASADKAIAAAREHAKQQRSRLAEAEHVRSSLTAEEQRAWSVLHETRDRIVALGAPPVDGTDLAAAWTQLTDWADERREHSVDRQSRLEAAVADLQAMVKSTRDQLAGLLAKHGITPPPEPGRVLAVVAERRKEAESELKLIRERQERKATLEQEVAAQREKAQVSTMLGNLLRANSFERWLCGEALDSLVTEASKILMELTSGQYRLDRDERNDLVVIDFADAGARRPVHTLSGGETFQASLALALALSHQVVGLSAGMRDLNSMFLDEGFGNLDGDTLDTVATTLERLAEDSDRMVGIVTHVPALAERVPVRFVVSRSGSTSSLQKERV